mmetsp:Transcript_80990/g.224027  ORF Transcript_80990/g.224027 Transcript_80990/m.224027 type:complete len:269 (-) Transcript_80990:214-1020(-)
MPPRRRPPPPRRPPRPLRLRRPRPPRPPGGRRWSRNALCSSSARTRPRRRRNGRRRAPRSSWRPCDSSALADTPRSRTRPWPGTSAAGTRTSHTTPSRRSTTAVERFTPSSPAHGAAAPCATTPGRGLRPSCARAACCCSPSTCAGRPSRRARPRTCPWSRASRSTATTDLAPRGGPSSRSEAPTASPPDCPCTRSCRWSGRTRSGRRPAPRTTPSRHYRRGSTREVRRPWATRAATARSAWRTSSRATSSARCRAFTSSTPSVWISG